MLKELKSHYQSFAPQDGQYFWSRLDGGQRKPLKAEGGGAKRGKPQAGGG